MIESISSPSPAPFAVTATSFGNHWHATRGDTAVNQRGYTAEVTLCGKQTRAAFIPADAVVTCPQCLRQIER